MSGRTTPHSATAQERKYLTIYCAARMSVWWSLIWQFGYGR